VLWIVGAMTLPFEFELVFTTASVPEFPLTFGLKKSSLCCSGAFCGNKFKRFKTEQFRTVGLWDCVTN
jgi:hypothetical protein